jgi:hypothetical protein
MLSTHNKLLEYKGPPLVINDDSETISSRLYYFDIDTLTLFPLIDDILNIDPSIALHLAAANKKYYSDNISYCSTMSPDTCGTNDQSNVQHNIIFFVKNTYGTLTDEILTLYTHKQTKMKDFIKFIAMRCRHMIAPPKHTCYPLSLRIEAVKREEEERKSDKIQEAFTKAETSWDIDWLEVALELQTNIAKSLCPEDHENFLQCVRYCPNEHIPHWKKFNRAGRGYFSLGSSLQDCLLFDATSSDSKQASLSSLLIKGVKTVIIASSVS